VPGLVSLVMNKTPVKTLEGLGKFPSLKEVFFGDTDELVSLGDVGKCATLTFLKGLAANGLTEIETLRECKALNTLNLDESEALTEAHVATLEFLMKNCDALETLELPEQIRDKVDLGYLKRASGPDDRAGYIYDMAWPPAGEIESAKPGAATIANSTAPAVQIPPEVSPAVPQPTAAPAPPPVPTRAVETPVSALSYEPAPALASVPLPMPPANVARELPIQETDPDDIEAEVLGST